MKTLKELVCLDIWSNLYSYVCVLFVDVIPPLQLSNDSNLFSLPLLTTFLRYFSRPFLGITPPPGSNKQISSSAEPGTLSSAEQEKSTQPPPQQQVFNEAEELVEKDIRDRFKRMCEGYFDSVSKKLLTEHNVGTFQIYPREKKKSSEHSLFFISAFKNKIDVTTRPISARAKSLKTGSKHTRR